MVFAYLQSKRSLIQEKASSYTKELTKENFNISMVEYVDGKSEEILLLKKFLENEIP